MGKRNLKRCPRCGGTMFLDRDLDGWYERCLNCSYECKLRSIGEYLRDEEKQAA